MKLELKHLLPYAPYKISVLVEGEERDLTAISLDSPFVFVTARKGSREKQMVDIEDIKLLLHPLDRLTDEMLHDLSYVDKDRFIWDVKNRLISVEALNDLLNNHYDVFGLIEKGLAEPIETSKAKGE